MPAVGNPSVVEELGEGVEVWNHSGVSTGAVMAAVPDHFKALLDNMGRWAQTTRGYRGQSRAGSLFDRDRYVTPDNVYDQMRLAYDAVETDDVVAGVLEATESLAFAKVDFFAEDPDEQDIYNQIARDVDLDSRLREMWRELFTVSQFYCAVWWQTKTYKVRGKNRKLSKTLRVPKAITILDSLKVVPVGMPLFGRERLAWVATREESGQFENANDPIFQRLVLGPYEATEREKRTLRDGGFDYVDSLWELNPANVFRHTATRPGYQMFASVRMKAIFELLDMKHQLRSMDRAHLIGGTNFIILITQGSDKIPGKPEEIAYLQSSVRTIAQTPVIIGDHRLDVKIVTPSLDATLDSERYDTLDQRIEAKLYQTFLRSGTDKAESAEGLVKVIAMGMESRRKMLRRTLEQAVLGPMFEFNDSLQTEPRLQYHPKEIALSFDSAFASFMLELRQSREISRWTLHNQFGLSEEFEAMMMEREAETFDKIFKTINPFNQANDGGGGTGPSETTPMPVTVVPKKAAGPVKKAAPAKSPGTIKVQRRQGGRQGGAAPGTGQGKKPVRPRRLAAETEGETDD